jgi:hypothetical protein
MAILTLGSSKRCLCYSSVAFRKSESTLAMPVEINLLSIHRLVFRGQLTFALSELINYVCNLNALAEKSPVFSLILAIGEVAAVH